MKTLNALWNDEAGFIVSSELVLIATILVIGLIVGLTMVRNSVVQELGDVAQAIGAISQDYSYSGTSKTNAASTAGSQNADAVDFCDDWAGFSVIAPAANGE